jgi:hypothetical protein
VSAIKTLILGAGYTGTRLAELLSKAPEEKVILTSRMGLPHIEFDLSRPETWSNLPKADRTFWTFSPEPESKVDEFLKSNAAKLGRLTVIGSTGEFLFEENHQWVDEKSPRDLHQERVRGENLVLESGGVLVCSSGIYGPERNPIDWMRQGRVAATEKYVNLINVVDLCRILLAASERGRAGTIYIASDAEPMTWKSLFSHFGVRSVSGGAQVIPPRSSKRVSSTQTLKELGITLQFPNVLEGLKWLDSQR